ncbi:FAD/FMN-containing dehydrogenase [Marinobacter segnicrescens]|uniref:FAD/FMN-containing dehydrogenase n=1 Tax=Marinobacter segnicrescens TaxID=430453 RepID=A0A1I0HWP4_9GAMM|nr:FAD-binding oxidoreductase [Marinobacter segnicrescens]SET88504.1 FAD/FMN-containing dehydrogenase [Marinobacter segnicrescens]
MSKVHSWGRLGEYNHDVEVLRDRALAPRQIQGGTPGLAFGMGRSYGDSCLNPDGKLWKTPGLDKLIRFDPEKGRLVCEAGVLLRDIQRVFVPQGWMLPVTPGTQMVTVGGAIANDVHGKNHHVFGSFGDQVHSILLARTDGEVLRASVDENPDWLSATIGGLGLTGVVLEAELQLRKVDSPWLDAETLPYESLNEFFELAGASEAAWEHTVSWIDCMNTREARGIFMRANHVCGSLGTGPMPSGKKKTMPFVPPVSLVNKLSLAPFNQLYFYLNKWKAGHSRVHYEPFNYPLDNLLEWNRMYGPRGFYQYQSVVPFAGAREAIRGQLDEIRRSGQGSFLAVLKTFGDRQPRGLLSFPMPGVTLALDFPNRGQRTLELFKRLDSIVREAGGRIYPAKDARMPAELFEAGYPKLHEFLTYRDPGISSAMSRRLMGY